MSARLIGATGSGVLLVGLAFAVWYFFIRQKTQTSTATVSVGLPTINGVS